MAHSLVELRKRVVNAAKKLTSVAILTRYDSPELVSLIRRTRLLVAAETAKYKLIRAGNKSHRTRRRNERARKGTSS